MPKLNRDLYLENELDEAMYFVMQSYLPGQEENTKCPLDNEVNERSLKKRRLMNSPKKNGNNNILTPYKPFLFQHPFLEQNIMIEPDTFTEFPRKITVSKKHNQLTFKIELNFELFESDYSKRFIGIYLASLIGQNKFDYENLNYNIVLDKNTCVITGSIDITSALRGCYSDIKNLVNDLDQMTEIVVKHQSNVSSTFSKLSKM